MLWNRWPLTLQLEQILRSKVASGELAPGGRIAPEVVLAKEYGVKLPKRRGVAR